MVFLGQRRVTAEAESKERHGRKTEKEKKPGEDLRLKKLIKELRLEND